MRKKRDLKMDTSGQALIEFALILPILLALTLGIIEFGWVLNGKITLTSAAREGARVSVIYENAEQASDAVDKAVKNSAESSSLTDVTAETTFDEIDRRAIVIVTAKITPLVGLYFSDDIELQAKAEMRIE